MPVKRIGNVFSKVIDMDVLRHAAKLACASRRKTRMHKQEVYDFLENDPDSKLKLLSDQVVSGTLPEPKYHIFITREREKLRLVADLPLYPYRILQWSIALVLEPEMDRKLIDQTYASRKGTGHHEAVRKLHQYMVEDDKVKYALVLDVEKFFESIDKDILKSKLRKVIKDGRMLELLDKLIDDYPLSGIPKGTRLSPMFANLYLSELDHELKERYHVHKMIRFMDDFAILGYSKQWLRRILGVIQAHLATIGLKVKRNVQIFPIEARGVSFLGYVTRKSHILLRKNTKVRMKRAARRIQKKFEDQDYTLDCHDLGTINSYRGALKWCSGKHLFKKTFGPILEMDRRNRERMEMNI